ncbi:hypothetical protein F5876DRAFT_84045 [Lentinula aff. lateritia]|uniref:Uncharacterized protein n=1 Tax=Lentinula aff. lateritia TaxID=2804960 RepID=A0ACC1THD5_9AGAR|nr:hypothetical protein F5876DRAFT_84045 [Lentinula aff. lateritia]
MSNNHCVSPTPHSLFLESDGQIPPSSWDTWDSDKDDNDDDDGWQLDDDGWQDLPIVHTDELRGGLDEEDQRKYLHRVNASASASGGGGRGNHLVDATATFVHHGPVSGTSRTTGKNSLNTSRDLFQYHYALEESYGADALDDQSSLISADQVRRL